MSETSEKQTVGVVLERRAVENKWVDHVWHAIGVIANAPPGEDWRLLAEGEGWVRYLAGFLDIELHRKETDGYKVNLESRASVFVVLRPDEEPDNPHEVAPFHVTVCPYEAEKYIESGVEIVDAVPMPDEVKAWVADFVTRHHVEVPFEKRKRKAYDPRKGDFERPRPAIRGGGDGGDG